MLSEPNQTDITFTDNPSTAKGSYICVNVNIEGVLQSWQKSIFARDWLDENGHLKPFDRLNDGDQQKLLDMKAKIEAGEAIPYPVLGIGLMDHIEIGSARAIFAYLCALGHSTMTVHIPQSNEEDFKEFLSD